MMHSWGRQRVGNSRILGVLCDHVQIVDGYWTNYWTNILDIGQTTVFCFFLIWGKVKCFGEFRLFSTRMIRHVPTKNENHEPNISDATIPHLRLIESPLKAELIGYITKHKTSNPNMELGWHNGWARLRRRNSGWSSSCVRVCLYLGTTRKDFFFQKTNMTLDNYRFLPHLVFFCCGFFSSGPRITWRNGVLIFKATQNAFKVLRGLRANVC